jgi:hypothetical protein
MNNLSSATSNVTDSHNRRAIMHYQTKEAARPVEDITGSTAAAIPSVVSLFAGNPIMYQNAEILPFLIAGRRLELQPAHLLKFTDFKSFAIEPAQVLFLDSLNSAITTIGITNYKQDTLNQYIDMVRQWKSALQPHHLTGLISRLEFIFEDEPEFELKQKPLSAESFSALLAYIAAKPEFKTPSISYTRDGSFSASWQTDKKVRLTLDFIGLTRIRWVFVDSRQGLDQVISGAGIVPTNMLQGILESYGGLEWMRR